MKRTLSLAARCAALFLAVAVPLLFIARLHIHPILQLVILAGLAIAAGCIASQIVHRSTGRLVALSRAYAERRFDVRLPHVEWDVLSELGDALHGMAQELSQKEQELFRRQRFESELSRFLRPALAAQIASGQKPLMLNGERCMVSVVFIDLVGCNGFAESAEPAAVVALLQEVVTLTTEIVFRHSGILDKSVGDCVMAVFGAPGDQRDHAPRAVAAAEDIKRFAQANAPRWRRLYSFDVQLAIGISTGEAVVGDLGSDSRLEYSAVGDVVTLAARLAALARPGQILLTTEVAAYTPAGFDFNSLGEQSLFGRRPAVTVLELS